MPTIDLYDSGEKQPWGDNRPDTAALRGYLQKVWEERPILPYRDEDESARRHTLQGFFHLDEAGIRAKKYVGFLQAGDLRINVYPGVFDGCAADKHYHEVAHVLHWLRYAKRLHYPFSHVPLDADLPTDWLEALIYLFAEYTHKALGAAPHFAYTEVVEEMAFVRGSIAMPEYIRNNLAPGRHHRLTCRYEPFLYDNLFNRIVRHTCRLLQRVSTHAGNKARLGRILFLLDEVSDVWCTAADCDRVQVNRLHPEVDTVRNMCRMFLQSRSGGRGAADNLCLLLPMEVIFEEYVAGFLHRHFPELRVQPQARSMFLAKAGADFATDVFQMRHDILIPNRAIIDTKYKFRKAGEDDEKAGISQGDMYQMTSYCYRRAISRGVLLYPVWGMASALSEPRRYRVPAHNDPRFIEVIAAEIDIRESNLAMFDEGQLEKFSTLTYLLREPHIGSCF